MWGESIKLLVESLVSATGVIGYVGVFLFMALESSFFPFPSEVVLVPAGVLVARGEMNFAGVLLAGTLGSLAGAFVNYFLALWFSERVIMRLVRKYGKFFLLKEESLLKAEKFFRRHGEVATFTGRLVPVIRQLISLPAGFSRMGLGRFTFFTSLGAALWSFILILLGVLYGNNEELIYANLSWLTLFLVILVVIILGVYWWFYGRRNNKEMFSIF